MKLAPLSCRLAVAPPRTRALLVAGAGAAAALMAAASDPLLATAGRAALAAGALGAVAWLARRRVGSPSATSVVRVAERHALSRDAAVALLEVRSRTLLVGYGADGVRLIADLGETVPEVSP